MSSERKFEFTNARYPGEQKLPERSTEGSAGYDFFCPIDITLEPNCSMIIPTGVKAKMPNGEVLLLFNRSSNPTKRGLLMLNGVGVIDSDYYSNPDNDGEIGFNLCNICKDPVTIKQGDKIGQGIFIPFMLAEEKTPLLKRIGGFGSTGK